MPGSACGERPAAKAAKQQRYMRIWACIDAMSGSSLDGFWRWTLVGDGFRAIDLVSDDSLGAAAVFFSIGE
jgi:hypothetical protein